MFERVAAALILVCLALGSARAQSPSPDEGRVFVLVVGVEDYSDPKITDLRYAEDDAQAVYEFFAKDPKSPTTAARVKLLRGAAATQRGIRRAIRDHLIRQATGPRDTAIFYFAGHGFADAYGVYLGTVDTKLVELELSALTWSDLQRDWSRISAGRRVFIADACHSGGLEGLRGPGGIGKRVLATRVHRFEFLGTRGQGAGKVALFGVELRLGPSKPDRQSFEMTLRGELRVFVRDVRLAGFELEGPLVKRGGKDREALVGSGTVRMARAIEVSRP